MKRTIISACIAFAASAFSLLHAQEQKAENNIPKNQITVSGGIGWVGICKKPNLSPWGKSYSKELKTAPEFGIRYSRLWRIGSRSARGVGMKLMFLNGNADYKLEGTNIPITDKILLTYLAPQYVSIVRLNKKFQSEFHVGVGYLNYHNNGKKDGFKYVTNGSGIGCNVSSVWSYLITPQFGIGVEIGVSAGWMWKLHQNADGVKTSFKPESDQKLNPSRFDSMISLHYNF